MADWFRIARPLLHCLPPEAVHAAGLAALRRGLLRSPVPAPPPELTLNVFDLTFPGPVGLAAGFDKNAVAIDALLAQGFAFVEAGTVTPRPQPGNPRPRLFRLREDEAVINRLGFNNHGLERFVQHFRRHDRARGIAGANIGRNKDSADALADYVAGLQAVYPYADYITVNISSPNTPGLRDLQRKEALAQLLAGLTQARGNCRKQHARHVPLLLKVSPDLGMQEKEDIADQVSAHHIDGLIISNTTVSRPPSLQSPCRSEQGGLSGRPLFALSTEALRDFYRLTGGKLPLIGVGGVTSAEDAYAKIRAGATLVQLYTALVYRGFGIVRNIHRALPDLLRRDGFSHVSEAVGTAAR